MRLLKRLCEEEKIDIDHGILQQLIDIANRESAEYVNFIVSQKMRNVFENQIGHVNYEQISSIFLLENNKVCKITFEKNELIENEYSKLLFQRPIYMESESMLDDCNSMTRRNNLNRKQEPIRPFLMADDINNGNLTLEQYQETRYLMLRMD